jgi:hypothetical protein
MDCVTMVWEVLVARKSSTIRVQDAYCGMMFLRTLVLLVYTAISCTGSCRKPCMNLCISVITWFGTLLSIIILLKFYWFCSFTTACQCYSVIHVLIFLPSKIACTCVWFRHKYWISSGIWHVLKTSAESDIPTRVGHQHLHPCKGFSRVWRPHRAFFFCSLVGTCLVTCTYCKPLCDVGTYSNPFFCLEP